MRIFASAMRDDWREFCADLRERRPVLDLPAFVFLTRRNDVLDVLSRPEAFTVPYASKMDAAVGPFMLARDGTALNWHDKSVLRTVLRWDDLPNIRTLAGDVSRDALKEATETDSAKIDIVACLSRKVPLRIVQQTFGFLAHGPPSDSKTDADMLAWSRAMQWDMFRNLENDAGRHAASVKAGSELRDWIRRLLEERKPWASVTGEDAISRLLRAHAQRLTGWTDEALVSNIAGLFVGSIETTSQAIVNAAEQILLSTPLTATAVVMAKACDAAAPVDRPLAFGRFDALVWEALRFNPVAPFVVRRAAMNLMVAPGTPEATPVPAGALVAASLGSAMFDGDAFPCPDSFHPRPRADYLHLGFGSHTCVGQYVAYEIIPEAVRHIMLLPGVSLLPDEGSRVGYGDGPFPESFMVGLQTEPSA